MPVIVTVYGNVHFQKPVVALSNTKQLDWSVVPDLIPSKALYGLQFSLYDVASTKPSDKSLVSIGWIQLCVLSKPIILVIAIDRFVIAVSNATVAELFCAIAKYLPAVDQPVFELIVASIGSPNVDNQNLTSILAGVTSTFNLYTELTRISTVAVSSTSPLLYRYTDWVPGETTTSRPDPNT